ncbi:hypothetical protein Vadar_020624 [Vaccinium darrowii]|uniref:Uncharacterized protein n=1 Tax=Vaccinium darrowii TaxID=229202 RepID=A0ACB7XIX4_9ERIC|nr:hypothetical protein Vadar_020624 [Vaccinium darrowii]
MMKRGREGDFDTLTTMANYLVLLSRGGGDCFQSVVTGEPSRVFECKTCNRGFSSFQALGGHRASHKRVRGMGGELSHHVESPAKPKSHECPICGAEFALGQALGGHMRRHRVAADDVRQTVVKKSSSNRRVLWLDLNLSPGENGLEFQIEKVAPPLLHCYL